MRYFLYVHISSFCLFGVNNADSVHGFHFSVLPFYTVSIKYENEIALAVSLIIAKNIYKHLPCTVKTAFRQFFEVLPGKITLYPSTSKYSVPLYCGFSLIFSRLIYCGNRSNLSLFGCFFMSNRAVSLLKICISSLSRAKHRPDFAFSKAFCCLYLRCPP